MPAYRTTFFYLLIFLLVAVTSCRQSEAADATDLVSRLKSQNIELAFDGFQITNDWSGPANLRSLEAANQPIKLRLQIVPAANLKAAERFVEMQKVIIFSAYKTIPSPYMAAVTKKVSCQEEFRPQMKTLDQVSYLSLPVNSRLAIGVCEKNEADFWEGLVFLHDPSGKRIVKLEVFAPFGDDGKNRLTEFYAKVDLKKYSNMTSLMARQKP